MAEEIKKAVVSDPLASADVNSDTLSAMSDTQTRRTIKLKPIARPDEHERKTAMLKNIAGELDKASVVSPESGSAAPVKPAAPVTAEAGDDATVRIQRPIALKKVAPAAAPKVVMPPGTPGEESRETIKIQPVSRETANDPDSSRTVKISLPDAGAAGSASRQTIKLKAQPQGAASEAESGKDSVRQTIKLKAPVQESAAAETEDTNTVKITAPKLELKRRPEEQAVPPVVNELGRDFTVSKSPAKERPFVTALLAVSLLLLLGGAGLAAYQLFF